MMGQWGPKHVAVAVCYNIIVTATKCVHLSVYGNNCITMHGVEIATIQEYL
jgi:hypothetical protein